MWLRGGCVYQPLNYAFGFINISIALGRNNRFGVGKVFDFVQAFKPAPYNTCDVRYQFDCGFRQSDHF